MTGIFYTQLDSVFSGALSMEVNQAIVLSAFNFRAILMKLTEMTTELHGVGTLTYISPTHRAFKELPNEL